MKKILLSSVALLGLTAAASAADLPRRAAPPVYAPAIPVFTWTGFYVGVNAGYAWGDNNPDDGVLFFPPGSIAGSPTTTGTLTLFNNNGGNDDGFTAGGTVGFNYQMGAVVLGLEGDLNWADLGGGNNNAAFGGTYNFTGVLGLAFAPPPATVVTNGRGGIDWFGTIRARAGFAFDRALIYATGGFAFGGGGGGNNGFCGGFGGCGDDDWRGGWTVGGGVEYAFTNNLTAKLEGLYVNLGNGDKNTVGAVYNLPTNTLFLGNGREDDSFGLVRVGVNYKFGS